MSELELREVRTFQISWPAEFGPFWLCTDNLMTLMSTNKALSPEIMQRVTLDDITDMVEDLTDEEIEDLDAAIKPIREHFACQCGKEVEKLTNAEDSR